MRYTYIPRGVCSRMIEVEIEDDVIVGCKFLGGCSGNTQGVARLVKGMDVYDAIDRLEGIDCGGRGTSCPDQLSIALKEAIES
ncbi:MAG: TIGR03905 family TSCPD domain-containing protein [Ruminococcaceae bacterium]|nr:TIGR03905 family TSCPD domain-containing protein [Oscillospiraceae bacterium]